MNDLAARTLDRSLVHGIAWLGGMKWVTQVISWSVTLVVARLLRPDDYGLFGMAMVFIGLVQLVGDAGLLAAIVKPRAIDDRLLSQLGGFAVMLGIALMSLSIGAGSLVALFFQEQSVQSLITLLSVTFVLRGLQALPRGLMVRRLEFRRVAWIDAAEVLVLTISTLGYALLGWSYWALALGVITGVAASTLLCLTWHPHRLMIPRDFASVREALTIGAHVLSAQLSWYVYSSADFVIVGRMLGRTALGSYTIAWTLANLAVERVTSLVVRVTPPVFAAVQNDPVAIRRYFCKLTEGLALMTMPACIGLSLVADVLILSLLGPTWKGAIMPLRLLGVYAMFRCIVALLPQVLIFTGHAKSNMKYSLIATLIMPAFFVFATRWGTTGVAAVWLVVYPALMAVTFVRHALKVIGLPVRGYVAALWPALSGTLVMSAVVVGLRFALPATLSAPVRLAVFITAGALTYVAMTLLLHGPHVRATLALLRSRPADADDGTNGGSAARPVATGATAMGATAVGPAPLYETSAIDDRPRLLLVSCHFPPDPVIGSLRWQKFARFAAQRGWGLDVIMTHPDELQVPDAGRIADLPPGVRVYGVRTRPLPIERFENAVSRLLRRVRRPRPSATSPVRAEVPQGFTPRDIVLGYHAMMQHLRGRRWVADAQRLGLALTKQGMHRAVISSAPPHFAHTAADRIARAARLPFVMDMRDPWSLAPRLSDSIVSPLSIVLAARDEARTVRHAALVAVNTAPMVAEMRRVYPDGPKFIAVPNGFDDDPLPPSIADPRFLLAYAGTIYLDRDPRVLFQAAAQVIDRFSLTPAAFGIEFMGDVRTYGGMGLDGLAAKEGVGAFVKLHPVRPHHDALAFLGSASMLVQLPQNSDITIPGKLYEYMRFPAWLLVLARPGNASEVMLRGLDADVAAPDDVEAIVEAISHRYEQHARGERATPLARHAQFGRRARAATFFDALEEIIGAPGAAVRPAVREAALPRAEAAKSLQQAGARIAPSPDLLVVLPSGESQNLTEHRQT